MPTITITVEELRLISKLVAAHADELERIHGDINRHMMWPDRHWVERLQSAQAPLVAANNLAAQLDEDLAQTERFDRWWACRQRFFKEQDRTRQYSHPECDAAFRAWADAIQDHREDYDPTAAEAAERAYIESRDTVGRWL